MFKTCSKCRSKKKLSAFYPLKGGRYGRDSRCADCVRAYQTAYRNKNRARIRKVIKACAQRRRATLEGYLAHAALNKRRNAAKIGVRCEITTKDLMELYEEQDGICPLSGRKMYWGTGRVNPDTLSIDRIDPDRGYTRDNIRLVTFRANLARGRSSDAEWTAFVEGSASVAKSAAPAQQHNLKEAMRDLTRNGSEWMALEGENYWLVLERRRGKESFSRRGAEP